MMVAGSIIVPIVMFYVQKYWVWRLIFNCLSILAVLVFGNIASLSIYKVIIENAVFMTNIHGVFLNPFFLISGAYLGVYVLYRLSLLTMEERQG